MGRGLRLTGQLGAMMKESARAARSFVWTYAQRLGITVPRVRNEMHFALVETIEEALAVALPDVAKRLETQAVGL